MEDVVDHLLVVGPIYWQDLQNALKGRGGQRSCDAYQCALLISTHERQHILQIREIRSDARFPKK
jgi:hypothetical protein